MTIPDFLTLMRPILAYLADGAVHRSREVKDAMADEFRLTDAERSELLPSGRQRTIDNRVGWALTYLTQAGLAARPSRGHVGITEEGRAALVSNPDRVDMKTLEGYPAYLEFRDRTREKTASAAVTERCLGCPHSYPYRPSGAGGGYEQGSSGGGGHQGRSRAIANRLRGARGAAAAAMGYGHAGSVERTSATGDAGVDGIISQDPLGLDRIYVQAKRYAVDQVIDRPKIHTFAGALLGKQGDRGVFITTSKFTAGARQEAEKINARIELIDGIRLAELLVQYGVGVQTEQVATLVRLDEDFFEGL